MARWYSDTTQIAWACEMLINGEEISHACEYEAVEGWRLSAIVEVLRKTYNWPVDTELRGEKRIGYYKLRAGTDPAKLQKPRSYNQYVEKRNLLEKEKGAATPSPESSDSNNPTANDNDT